jgi:hypothetical protein
MGPGLPTPGLPACPILASWAGEARSLGGRNFPRVDRLAGIYACVNSGQESVPCAAGCRAAKGGAAKKRPGQRSALKGPHRALWCDGQRRPRLCLVEERPFRAVKKMIGKRVPCAAGSRAAKWSALKDAPAAVEGAARLLPVLGPTAFPLV